MIEVNGLDNPGYGNYRPSVGTTTTAPARKADPSKEYVAAGVHWGQPDSPRSLPPTVDEVVRDFGPSTYAWMDRDPACHSAKEALKLAIVAGGMDLSAADAPKPGVKERTPDQKQSADLVDFVWRNVERCPAFESTVRDLLEACRTGCRLAEFVLELAADGPDSGKLVLRSLRTKPNDQWRFVVDEYNEVVGIESRPGNGKPGERYPADKFVWLSWEPTDGDPRGTSVYRAAHEAANLKRKVWPQFHKYLHQFASPSILGKTAPGEPDRDEVDANGLPTGRTVTAQQYMANSLVAFQNGSVMVVPAGAEVAPIQPQGNGEAFRQAADLLNREITQAILLQTRATLEALHGSKADSITSQDIFGLIIEAQRKSLSDVLRGLFRRIIAINFGDDVASRLTPLVTFGQTDHQDRPALWGAASGLKSSGYLGESQVQELDQMIGLPIRDLQADEAKAKAKADEAMKQMQSAKGPPGPPSAGGKAGSPPAGKNSEVGPARFARDFAEFARGGGGAKGGGKKGKAAAKAKAKGAVQASKGGLCCKTEGGKFAPGNNYGSKGGAKSSQRAAAQRVRERLAVKGKSPQEQAAVEKRQARNRQARERRAAKKESAAAVRTERVRQMNVKVAAIRAEGKARADAAKAVTGTGAKPKVPRKAKPKDTRTAEKRANDTYAKEVKARTAREKRRIKEATARAGKAPETHEGVTSLLKDPKTGLWYPPETQKAILTKYVEDRQSSAKVPVKAHGMSESEDMHSMKWGGTTYHYPDAGRMVDHVQGVFIPLAGRPLPAELTRHTHTVIFTKHENNDNPRWQESYKDPTFKSNATGGDGRIVVYGSGTLGVGSLSHEMGHNLANGRYGQTDATGWKAYGGTSEYGRAVKSGEPPVSDYAKHNGSEDFAESARVYVRDPDAMRANHPRRYEVIDRLMKDPNYNG